MLGINVARTRDSLLWYRQQIAHHGQVVLVDSQWVYRLSLAVAHKIDIAVNVATHISEERV